MGNSASFLQHFSQNNRLPIRVVSPTFGRLPPTEVSDGIYPPQQRPFYFMLFMVDGASRHRVDLEHFDVQSNELLFILPHQIHHLPPRKNNNYFKLGFDEDCLSLLPQQYPFLVNPHNNQKVKFTLAAGERVKAIFEMLIQLLSTMDTEPALIIAHLNSLLTEINTAYFAADKNPADDKLSKYIHFKLLIESNLTNHPSVISLAEQLALNTNSLYTLVKHYSGVSPKEFINNRLILEAKRRLYYSKCSIKELAYDLGFNDPEYFSRLFKKVTGQTVTTFVQDLWGN
jgi:AraC family transcriptional regulator, transcriptional activator of pobA